MFAVGFEYWAWSDALVQISSVRHLGRNLARLIARYSAGFEQFGCTPPGDAHAGLIVGASKVRKTPDTQILVAKRKI